MPKQIYTERDLEEMARKGVREIAVTDDVYLTDVARERAEKLGIALKKANAAGSAPAPAGNAGEVVGGSRNDSSGTQADRTAAGLASIQDSEQVIARVKADVLARLGPSVDATIIDRIVRRVVSQLK